MSAFENELFTTVDAILKILGQKPKFPRDTQNADLVMHPSAKDIASSSKTKGARLIRTVNDLDRVFANI
jgi:hypothetical protein